MSDLPLKPIGIGCFVVCAISMFVAWERYQDNANRVAAANKMMSSSPFGGMMQQMTGGAQMEPGVPTASKYGIAIGVLAAVVGVVCVSMPVNNKSKKKRRRVSASADLPDRLPGLGDSDGDEA
jgi:hypothetical protein